MAGAETGAPLGWKVKVRPGDTLRLNAVYDDQISSWYENMGIVVGYIAPKDPHGPPGLDVFSKNTRIVDGVPPQAKLPPAVMMSAKVMPPSRLISSTPPSKVLSRL